MAKFLEEMKGLVRELPVRVAERMSEGADPLRRRRFRRFHPMMFDEVLHMSGDPGDPIGLLILASMVREDLPWFYEIALEIYHALRAGDHAAAEREAMRLNRMSEMFMRGPFMEEIMGMGGIETHMFFMELPRLVDHMIHRCIGRKKVVRKRRIVLTEKE